jgi:hypothetical protein
MNALAVDSTPIATIHRPSHSLFLLANWRPLATIDHNSRSTQRLRSPCVPRWDRAGRVAEEPMTLLSSTDPNEGQGPQSRIL